MRMGGEWRVREREIQRDRETERQRVNLLLPYTVLGTAFSNMSKAYHHIMLTIIFLTTHFMTLPQIWIVSSSFTTWSI